VRPPTVPVPNSQFEPRTFKENLMKRRAFAALTLIAGLSAAAVTAGSALLASSSSVAPVAADAFEVDAVHSAVMYKVKHLGAAWNFGRFNDFTGSFALEDGGSIEITVKADSVDSANKKRDDHLRSPDFFSTKEFPEITFKSKSMTKTGDNTFDVTGDLTLRGTTKPVTLKVEKTGEGQGRGGSTVAGMYAEFTVKRSDFGVSYSVGPIGDEVTLIVSLEGTK
jgi:polyisoprenoid-binding protein YceI